MDREAAQGWLDRYVEAWRANEPASIEGLFTADATYRYHPSSEPVRGRTAIATSWLEDPDEPGSWDAWYEPYAIEGDAVVAIGVSTYFGADGAPERVYDNAFIMRFVDGRCAEFREWFDKRPDAR
jgi:ketosteroid isomerase-like protein